MPRNPFAFDDYFVQDYIATVEKVEFTTSDYDRLQAVFTNRYDEPVVGDDGQTRTHRNEYYNIGSSDLWVPINNGTSFEHATGDSDKRIRSDSGFGKLLVRTIDLLGEDLILKRAGGDNIYAAPVWEDLRFHFVTEGAGERWENKKAGTSGTTKGAQLPVEWLPDLGDSGQAVLATYDLPSVGLSDDDLLDLMTLAKGLTLGEFQSKGISHAKGLQDAAVRSKLQVALSDQSFYETLRAS
jgi:hypothetical protein